MFSIKDNYNINDLVDIVAALRAENGCPWDKEQDHHSIRMNLLEEAYEVAEAIDNEDTPLLREELGDLLLQVVFHTQIEREQNTFDFDEVCDEICKKLVYRHPHVFGDVSVSDTDQVLDNWEKLKQKSKGQSSIYETLESVPKTLPALMRGQKVLKRAEKGMQPEEKPKFSQAIANARKQLDALESAVSTKSNEDINQIIGDYLLESCQISRILDKDSEKLLTESINKFIMRFRD